MFQMKVEHTIHADVLAQLQRGSMEHDKAWVYKHTAVERRLHLTWRPCSDTQHVITRVDVQYKAEFFPNHFQYSTLHDKVGIQHTCCYASIQLTLYCLIKKIIGTSCYRGCLDQARVKYIIQLYYYRWSCLRYDCWTSPT